MKSYEGSTPQKLHYVYAKKIISEVKEIFQKHKALVSLSVPEGGHLTVVGDTHGQLIDVLTIFQLRGKLLIIIIIIFIILFLLFL